MTLDQWDTKPDKRIRRTFLRPASTRRTSFYAAIGSAAQQCWRHAACVPVSGPALFWRPVVPNCGRRHMLQR
jgi:hypothetical protein